MSIRVLTEQDLRQCVQLDAGAIDAVEQAFAALGRGEVEMPPILRLDVAEHNGEVDVKTAYVKGFPGFCVKMSTGFFNNPAKGLKTGGGMMTLLDSETGQVKAVMLDNGYLTDVRTAAAGALAAKLLSRPETHRAAILGTGLQARMQVEALLLVRPNIDYVACWGRDITKAHLMAEDLAERLKPGIVFDCFDSVYDAVRHAGLIVTATASTEPILHADWLDDGQHITAMGSDAEHKNELDPSVLARADVLVCDSRSQSARLGELRAAISAGTLPADAEVTELGQIAAGLAKGRNGNGEITVCDLTGTGAQDTAIASLAFERAVEKGLGEVL